MISPLLKMITGDMDGIPFIDRLDASSFDELVEIDVINDRCRNIYHVENKYFVPIFDGTYRDLFRYCTAHMIHPQDRLVHEELMKPDTLLRRLELSPLPGVLSAQFRYKTVDGGWRWVEQVVVGGEQHRLGEGIVRFYVFDIQNQKTRETGKFPKVKFNLDRARDQITGLLLGKAFFQYAKTLLDDLPAGEWCMAYIDIEHFRLFNDWYGREAGDMLLAEVGARLAEVEADTGGLAGYLGADDFAILMPLDLRKLEQLYTWIHEEITRRGTSVGFLPAIGIGVLDKQMQVLDLFDRAHLAAAHAKGNYQNRIVFFKSSMLEHTEKEYRILNDFQKALQNGEIFFVLQPQCHAINRKIVGAECLARWRRADGSMVSPMEFVPVLEKHGFITDLDRALWEQVCVWLRKRLDANEPVVPISVNVSQIDVLTLDVAEELERLRQKYDLPAKLLKAEITESAYAENTLVVKDTVQKLRNRGFMVLMDDFGSGYSSLNMLGRLNVDVIKLDAQFLRLSAANTDKSIHILESIISMAKSIALPIIVEGVEEAQQVEFLTSQGCRYIQGYYFYRPVPVAEFERLISTPGILDKQGIHQNPNEQFRIREFLDQNIYSDAMLNSILGSVAYYAWHEQSVDIIRYNQQFKKAVNVTHFNDRLEDIQQFVPDEDLPALYGALQNAVNDRLNGATGMIRFYKPNGTWARFLIHFYYLGEKESGRVFYGSANDLTALTEFQDQMRLLTSVSAETVIFAQHYKDRWRYRVAFHGLEKDVGLTQAQLQKELDDYGAFDRLDPATQVYLLSFLQKLGPDFPRADIRFRLTGGDGKPVAVEGNMYYTSDTNSNTEYVIILRRDQTAPPDTQMEEST